MTLLQDFPVMDTKRLSEARQIVGSKFCDHRLEIQGKGNRFHARHFVAPGRLLSLNYLSYGETVLIEPGELETFYLIQIPVSGHADIANGGHKFTTGIGKASILNPDRHTAMVWHAACEQLLIYLPKEGLQALVRRLLGRAIVHDVVFQPEIDFADPALAPLRQCAIAFAKGADQRELFGESRALNQNFYEEKFITNLLISQPSNVRCFFDSQEKAAAPRAAKIARDFIVEHAHRPIGLSDMAAEANVPVRTLQHQFRCFYDLTPTEFLRQERLRHVHSELSSGHAHGDLAGIAKKWGFSHVGRFSRYYCREFGELPSRTKADALRLRSRHPRSERMTPCLRCILNGTGPSSDLVAGLRREP